MLAFNKALGMLAEFALQMLDGRVHPEQCETRIQGFEAAGSQGSDDTAAWDGRFACKSAAASDHTCVVAT